jgi:hypothetical protein
MTMRKSGRKFWSQIWAQIFATQIFQLLPAAGAGCDNLAHPNNAKLKIQTRQQEILATRSRS